MKRESMLDAVRDRVEPWDVIVIGGGATGAGCCLDAAARGLDVLLLEQHDFGKGTSSRSTKLIHGGFRYLAQGNISLVREALRERGILAANAGKMVQKQTFVVPCYSLKDKYFYGIGLKIYDMLAGKLSFGKSVFLSRKETISRLPDVSKENLKGGILYYDGRFDDSKLLLEILKTAAAKGASVVNYAPVTGVRKVSGKIDGVRFQCVETGEEFAPHAKAVINATGVFSDEVRTFSEPKAKKLLMASRGTHLVFDAAILKGDQALMIPKTSDGRVLFAIPFYGKLLVGTTDTPIGIPVLEPKAAGDEISFILEACEAYFEKPLRREDIRSVFAGIRPLVADGSTKSTARLSRGHHIEVDRAGLVTITGGKWTTYRNMAEDAVDKAIAVSGLAAKGSVTANLPIGQSDEFDEIGLERLVSPDFEWTIADVVRSVRFDMARTVEDVLARRTRILFLDAREAVRVAPLIAEVVAGELGKGSEWIDEQLKSFGETADRYMG